MERNSSNIRRIVSKTMAGEASHSGIPKTKGLLRLSSLPGNVYSGKGEGAARVLPGGEAVKALGRRAGMGEVKSVSLTALLQGGDLEPGLGKGSGKMV